MVALPETAASWAPRATAQIVDGAVYKFGKWSIGPVGYFEVQTTNDTGTCNPVIGGVVQNFCGRYRTGAAGGLIGYDFGLVDLQVCDRPVCGSGHSRRRRPSDCLVAPWLQDLGT